VVVFDYNFTNIPEFEFSRNLNIACGLKVLESCGVYSVQKVHATLEFVSTNDSKLLLLSNTDHKVGFISAAVLNTLGNQAGVGFIQSIADLHM